MKQIILTAILILGFCSMLFAQINESVCPKINLVVPEGITSYGAYAKIAVELDDKSENSKLEYIWTTSAGQIIQRYKQSEINLFAGLETEESTIKVTVKLIGLPDNCGSSASDNVVFSAPVGDLFPDDDYGKIPIKDEKARLDLVLARVQTINNDAEGFIVLNFKREGKRSSKISRLNNIINHMKYRKVDLFRFTFVISEGESERSQLWTMVKDTYLPPIESTNYQLVKAEELKQNLKELFPKN